MAQYIHRWVRTPMFVINSAMDFFQTLCILTGKVHSSGCLGIPGWHDCRYNLNNCTATQMDTMLAFERAFIRTFRASAAAVTTQSQPGTSSFIYSCHNHVAGDSPLFQRIIVANLSMAAAVQAWWGEERAAEPPNQAGGSGLTDVPCLWHRTGADRRCNPTCYKTGL